MRRVDLFVYRKLFIGCLSRDRCLPYISMSWRKQGENKGLLVNRYLEKRVAFLRTAKLNIDEVVIVDSFVNTSMY